MGIFFHVAGLRPPHIMPPPATGVDIIDNSNIVYNGHIGIIVYIVTAHVRPSYIRPGEKGPVIGRRPVTVPGFTNLNIGPYGCPAIISAIFSPGDPCRGPVIPWHPHPSIGIIIKPIAIMKRRPSPVVVGEPGPAVRRKNPMPRSSIRPEPCTDRSGYPYITIPVIIHPGSVRCELLIKNLKADRSLSAGGVNGEEQRHG
jgi:hypothetical protein